MNPIRLLLADNQTIVRKGICGLLQAEPDLQVIGEASTELETIQLARDLRPDIILLDVQMAPSNGAELIQTLHQTVPASQVIVLTTRHNDKIVHNTAVFAAVQSGALGYLLKEATPESLIQAIHDVQNGRPYLQSEITYQFIQEIARTPPNPSPAVDTMTEREIEVLQWIARGLTNQQIADQLIISERTVRTHISHILEKLHVANRTQAALYALRQGLASLDQ